MKQYILTFILFSNITTFAQSGLVINEIVAKNNFSLVTSENDAPDWIELYNSNDLEIDLENYTINDNQNEWVFPKTTIAPDEYLIILASDLDTITDSYLHTNFKLSSDGELITLRDNASNLIDSISYPSLNVDESFGRSASDEDSWSIFSVPTPKTENKVIIAESDLIALQSSHQSGFYPDGLELSFSALDDGQIIRYTLDGSLPGSNSLIYEEGKTISITQHVDKSFADKSTSDEVNSLKDNFPTTALLRAVIFKDDIRVSRTLNQTFWLMDNPHTLPIVSLIGEEADFFDEDIGIYLKGNNDNYFQIGKEWERPIHVSFFDSSGDLLLNQSAGIRLGGAKTRQNRQKTLRLYARSEYGKNSFDYPFWGEEYGTSFRRITLRTFRIGSLNKSAIMDDLIHEIIDGEVNTEYVKRKFSVVYINGNYWGIHSFREHNNQHFLERKYDIDDKDIVVSKAKVNALDSLYFDLLVRDIQNMDLTNEFDYKEVASRLDIEQYTDYMLTNITFANRDWPHNNVEYWYSEEFDGKIRFIINDLDATMTVHNDERLDLFISEQAIRLDRDKWFGTLIFLQKLLEESSYRDFFNQRLNTLLHTTFSPSNTISKLKTMVEELSPEIDTHINRWHFPNDKKQWNTAVNRLEQFLLRRPNYLINRSNELFGFPIKTYPNPIQNKLSLELDAWSDGDVEIKLFDLNGILVLEQTSPVLEGKQTINIETPNLMNGTYIINVQYQSLTTNEILIILK